MSPYREAWKVSDAEDLRWSGELRSGGAARFLAAAAVASLFPTAALFAPARALVSEPPPRLEAPARRAMTDFDLHCRVATDDFAVISLIAPGPIDVINCDAMPSVEVLARAKSNHERVYVHRPNEVCVASLGVDRKIDSRCTGHIDAMTESFGAGFSLIGDPPAWAFHVHDVSGGVPSVVGALPTHVIQDHIYRSLPDFRACYESGLGRNPTLAGSISTRFEIHPLPFEERGEVRNAENAASSIADEAVVACVTRAFAQIRFPEPEDDAVTVIYPLVFTPRE